MNSLRQFPLGAPYPESPHAVVSCLPTMADVHGYERHEPRVIAAMDSGYPRFVVHAFIRQLIALYLVREGLSGHLAVLVPGRRATQDLLDAVGVGVSAVKVEERLFLVYVADAEAALFGKVQKFIQHTGCGISSREAEDLLVQHGQLDAAFSESTCVGNAQGFVEAQLSEQIGCRQEDVLLCASGMNAFYAGFRAVQEYQSARGRKAWLQLGWLYLDSGCVLKEFLDEGSSLDYCYDVTATDDLIQKIESLGDSLACVVVECPTNPLVQVCDLARVATAVRQAGGVLVVDPTIASIYSVDVLPYADLLVSSLTKYASFEGDVMIGALALNPDSSHYGGLILRSSANHQPPYARDLARLAHHMESAPGVVSQMDASAAQLAAFLREHPAVKRVHYAGHSEHFPAIAKNGAAGGAMVTIELNGSVESFYDAVAVMKGPSFGTEFTLLSPFMYLAHYDLVTADSGRAFLRGIGIDPDLIRISVGAEPYAAIEAALLSALCQLGE